MGHLPPVLILVLASALEVFSAAVLFDNTKNETAGNADWVIDNDAPVPLPAQGTIDAATPGAYWTGAISSWGVALVKLGHSVSTLGPADSITYGAPANPRDLSRFKVYVVCEPQRPFTPDERKAVFDFVRNGGGLFMIADHDVSDRDNDGWDSPRIWNDIGIQDSFGLAFNGRGDPGALSNFSESSRGRDTSSVDSIVNGPGGRAESLAFHAGAAIALHPAANPSAAKHFWRSANPDAVMCASARFGKGKVVGIGDSSPADDSTGNPGNTLYNGWGEGGDSAVILNATHWLSIGPPPATGLRPATPPGNPGTRLRAVWNANGRRETPERRRAEGRAATRLSGFLLTFREH